MSLLLNIPMPPLGKARPRLGKGRVHMPTQYVQWKKTFGIHARNQVKSSISGAFHINVCLITKTGKMLSDIDNVSGAILDSLQDCGIIGNDRDCTNLSINITKGKQTFMVILLTEAKRT